ncbi:MAG: T9SS C-terminal target domain-containing protein, partial [Calditrichaeota bacterium]
MQKLTILLILLIAGLGLSQEHTNIERLNRLKEKYHQRYTEQRAIAEQWALDNGYPIREVHDDGTIIEIQKIINGKPLYLSTENSDAAETISTDEVWSGGSAGLNLDGTGIAIGEWDGGSVLGTHQELTGRVTQEDSPSGTSTHATHVAGTMIASGVDAAAQGMAEGATLRAWDYTDDTSEMAGAASSLLMSNHSYGFLTGWYLQFGIFWTWAGDDGIDSNEDWKFGYYTADTQEHDQIAYDAPYYLICKSSGNDRGQGPTSGAYPQDGSPDGYDTCGPVKVAKNILTVGAVEDIPGGWTQTSDVVMSSFSSWGPADDGRIKPDVVGNGVGLYSSSDAGNTDYTTYSGTSMATPNVTGSLALLAQHYQALSSGSNMRSATLKALAIHTADEAGNTGPDYTYGWGLVNVKSAAELISEVFVDQTNHTMQEQTLNNSGTYSIQVTSSGAPLKVTIVWTDVPGTPVTPVTQADPTDLMLVNDLDLRITGNSTTYNPWILDPTNPSNAATTGDNFRDNVEQVYIASPVAGTYTITVNHKGTLSSGSQAFSLIMSGAHFSDNSLPVELSSFAATQIETGIKLSWSTESENKNMGFEIYKAEEDGEFELIADYNTNPQLRGAGNSSTKNDYKFIDSDINLGKIYRYKLADMDYSGRRTFHDAISILASKTKFGLNKNELLADEYILLDNYPNPFNPATTLSFNIPNQEKVNLSIYNALGQLVTTLVNKELS